LRQNIALREFADSARSGEELARVDVRGIGFHGLLQAKHGVRGVVFREKVARLSHKMFLLPGSITNADAPTRADQRAQDQNRENRLFHRDCRNIALLNTWLPLEEARCNDPIRFAAACVKFLAEFTRLVDYS